MYQSISFCVGNKTIEVNGQLFDAGELTAECLSIPSEDYRAMRRVWKKAQAKMTAYTTSHDPADWFAANEAYLRLDRLLCRYRLFRLLKDDTAILSEAREFTQQYALFEDDPEPTEQDLEILAQRKAYEDYLEHPEEFGGIDEFQRERPPVPPVPPEKTRALLISPGNTASKWEAYRNFTYTYTVIMEDLRSFNNTIYHFINGLLSELDKLTPNNYAAALNYFLYHDRSDKLVANPVSGTGLYSAADHMMLWHIPRETFPGSGEYKIYEYYEVQTLQAFLKTDFYKALEVGYTIRKCDYCGRYFLLKNARHTKYCGQPAPDNPRYTCAQMGYHLKGVKEAAGDDPLVQSLRRCFQRIDQDFSRGIIKEEDREQLHTKAKDLFHHARTAAGTSYDEFEESLASKNLYPLCGVQRKTKPRGRPKRSQ